jgi:hypothetical protein
MADSLQKGAAYKGTGSFAPPDTFWVYAQSRQTSNLETGRSLLKNATIDDFNP